MSMFILFLLCCGPFNGNSDCDTASNNWTNWGNGFFLTWCSSCHASHSVNRNGAPDSTVFDTPEQVLRWKERIEYRVIQEQTMPVGGGIPEQDLKMLKEYLQTLEQCGEG
jgi:uncharacterized membrane protein